MLSQSFAGQRQPMADGADRQGTVAHGLATRAIPKLPTYRPYAEALAAGEPAISADAKKDKKEVRRPPLIARLAYAINE
jgi:hypothetical protein